MSTQLVCERHGVSDDNGIGRRDVALSDTAEIGRAGPQVALVTTRMSARILTPRIAAISALTLLLSTAAAHAAITRVEQNDKNIVYSGNWYSNENPGHSGGTAALTNTRGSRLTLSFTGTGITWIGVMDAWSGYATVYIDGKMTLLYTYSTDGRYQRPMFTANGLSAGPHTLSIEVMHERGPGTDGSWVWIDAFEIENGGPLPPDSLPAPSGRVEESNPALAYFGRWFANTNPGLSAGAATLATDAGARVNITFNGTGITWVTYQDEWSGVARVYLDGQVKTEVDNYLSPSATRVAYSINGLPSGSHTLSIEVTGIHNQSSKGSWIWLDAFDVTQ